MEPDGLWAVEYVPSRRTPQGLKFTAEYPKIRPSQGGEQRGHGPELAPAVRDELPRGRGFEALGRLRGAVARAAVTFSWLERWARDEGNFAGRRSAVVVSGYATGRSTALHLVERGNGGVHRQSWCSLSTVGDFIVAVFLNSFPWPNPQSLANLLLFSTCSRKSGCATLGRCLGRGAVGCCVRKVC